MNLSKKSSDLIKILSNDPEKLKKINLLNDEEMIYNYIKDEIMPNYTKEDFDEFKRVLSELDKSFVVNPNKPLNTDELNSIGGGIDYGTVKDVEDICKSFNSGYSSSEGKTISKVFNTVGNFFAKGIKSIKEGFEKNESTEN